MSRGKNKQGQGAAPATQNAGAGTQEQTSAPGADQENAGEQEQTGATEQTAAGEQGGEQKAPTEKPAAKPDPKPSKGGLIAPVAEAAKKAEKDRAHGDHSVLASIEMRLGELAQLVDQYEDAVSDEAKAILKRVKAAL